MTPEAGTAINYNHNLPPSRRNLEQQRKNHRHPIEAEGRPISPLFEEIDAIKRSGEQSMYLLPGTGFQVKGQVDLLLENRAKGVSLSESFNQLDQDIQGFKTEYLVELPVFPILLEKKMHEGKERVVGKLYGDKPLTDTVSADERDGVVKNSIQKVEEALLDAKPGTLIVMASPGGWSGYQSKGGRLEALNRHDILSGKAKEIKYPDSQTYCFEVLEDGGIRAFTLKTDMTLSQNKQLLTHLGGLQDQPREQSDEITSIKEIVGNVLVIDPNKNKKIEDVAKTIKHIKEEDVAYRDSRKELRYFSEMFELLKNPEGLWTLDEKTRVLTAALRAYMSERSNSEDTDFRSDLETALGLTILKLMHEVRPPKQEHIMDEGRVYGAHEVQSPVPFNAKDTYEELKKIAGCAGGGVAEDGSGVVSSVTPRLSKEGKLKEGCECLDKSDNHYHCPDCDKKYEDETHKEKRTEECDCGFEFGC